MQKSRILLFEKAKSTQKITAGLLLINKRIDIHASANGGKKQNISLLNAMIWEFIFKHHIIKRWNSGH